MAELPREGLTCGRQGPMMASQDWWLPGAVSYEDQVPRFEKKKKNMEELTNSYKKKTVFQINQHILENITS